MKSFEGSFRNLKFSPSTSILLNFFFPFIDIKCFFSSFKLQYCRTIVLLNKLKLFKVAPYSFSGREEWELNWHKRAREERDSPSQMTCANQPPRRTFPKSD